MAKETCFENYPAWIVCTSNALSLLILALGALVIANFGPLWLALYLLYYVFLFVRVLERSCTRCYYYGRTCAFGYGRLAGLLFRRKKGRLTDLKITWKDMLPDFLIFLVPALAGIVLLITIFNWSLLVLVVFLFFLGFMGNYLVRSNLACKFCKQRGLGCPAEKMFGKTGK